MDFQSPLETTFDAENLLKVTVIFVKFNKPTTLVG